MIIGTPSGYRGDGVVKHFWELVEYHRINFFSGVPTVYASLMQQPTQGRDLSSLEYGLCGAAPMPVELMRSFQELTGLKILEGYGLTEGTCVSTCNPPLGDRRMGSIGLRVPLQAMKAVMLDDAGAYARDCAVGEAGVLAISGPNAFAGYRDPDQDKGIWLDLGDGRRWMNTGDLGRQDADGYFYLTGRKKELIIRGGHNIDPANIEEPLHRHPAVQLAAAVGRPDVHAGELPVAYVQLSPGVSVTEDELISFAKDQITERAAVPKAIRLVTTMPLTGVGKIFKPELRKREIMDALRAALHDAGVPTSGLEVVNDLRSGIRVEVTVARSASVSIARNVLGQFPFRFEVWEQAAINSGVERMVAGNGFAQALRLSVTLPKPPCPAISALHLTHAAFWNLTSPTPDRGRQWTIRAKSRVSGCFRTSRNGVQRPEETFEIEDRASGVRREADFDSYAPRLPA